METATGEVEMVDKNNAAALSNSGAPALATTKRKKRPSTVDGAYDDIVGTIRARLPARTAIACTALSKHHRSLIRSPEFRSLHCRLAAPLPSPHVAYIATATLRRRPEQEDPASGYFGFQLAGAGLTGNGDTPIRWLAGWRYLGTKCVNTCNGVLLLATNGFSKQCRCTLWNSAVADVAGEATISAESPPSSSEEETSSAPILLADGKKKIKLWDKETQFLALGLGYGQRCSTYKLLLFPHTMN